MVTVVAAAYRLLPACVAVIVAVPAPIIIAVALLMVSTFVLPLTKVTGSPLLAVAVRGMVPPLVKVTLVPLVGEEKVMVCEACATLVYLSN